MIFADKLIQLRKRNGWSQEELAERMNVTRQSVSKWESTQSVPDIEKIIKLSELFGVSIDYLLKDSIDDSEYSRIENVNENIKEENTICSEEIPLMHLSTEETERFLAANRLMSRVVSFGVMLCIMSPISILILGGAAERGYLNISKDMSVAMGVTIMLILIAAAVAMFIYGGFKTAPYEYLENEIFEADSSAIKLAEEKKEDYTNRHRISIVSGVSLFILAVIPVFASRLLDNGNDFFKAVSVSFTLILIAIGVLIIVKSSIIWGGFERILQEGDYSVKKKADNSMTSTLSTIYWSVTLAIFLAYSLISGNWDNSWIIWVVASIIYPALKAFGLYIIKDKK